jgi:heme exporter protein D
MAANATAPLSPTLLWPIVIGLLIVAVLIRFVVFFADGQHPWYIWPGIAVVVYGIALTTARALKKAARRLPTDSYSHRMTRVASRKVGRDAWEVPTTDTGAHDE